MNTSLKGRKPNWTSLRYVILHYEELLGFNALAGLQIFHKSLLFQIKAEYEDTIQSLENLIKGLCHELHRQLDRNCNILLSNDCCGSVARNGITGKCV